eukprot:MONOS_8640.1-p1 / transcript=MONOS_8640.1 / gene=MONOS_8640 / organism=Monocercomonoides_exilis_PA203 / gene_product=Tre-2/Bub2/Cdc16 (TBC) domain-containing protein D / transcript_product=Tre-2/Bub2/Cdc16 (TBC) domain-containing protein D / location=Mono_scaffold00330:60538-61727(+) / protein_length=352 / sequence_SO=supercontig / SO=protein_coding / is_pseudo=false
MSSSSNDKFQFWFGFPHDTLTEESQMKLAEYERTLQWSKIAEKDPTFSNFVNKSSAKNLCRAGAFCNKLKSKSQYRYEQYISMHETENPSTYQDIENDLTRTFPEHPVLSQQQSMDKMRNILRAYSWRNPTIGYCQSMSFIVGLSMLVFEREEDCFWLLVHLLESIPSYHSKSMRDARIDLKVMDDLMKKYANKLYTHIHSLGYSAEFICVEWFLTLFSKTMAPEFVFRVWDAMMIEGNKILFRVSLGCCMYFEKLFLLPENKNRSPMAILSEEGKKCVAVEKIFKKGFGILNFSRTTLNRMRKENERVVDKENEEVEALRKRDKERKEKAKLKEDEKKISKMDESDSSTN